MKEALLYTNVAGFPMRRGKVRDVYDLGEELVIVTTDRLSAFDRVLASGIPDRGRILNQMTVYWLEELDVESHLTWREMDLPEAFQVHAEQLNGRTMLVDKAVPFPVECIVRGYLCGSAWKSYKDTGKVYGQKLPAGLKENAPLPKPMFTPTTKSDVKDEEITYDQMCDLVGKGNAEVMIDRSIDCYQEAALKAWESGIIIADTKFEWGKSYGSIILIDEVLTPDSSRFWPLEDHELGKSMPSFDKQYVRDYLEGVWDRKGDAPKLPDDVIEKTRQKYLDAYARIVGGPLVGV